MESKGRFRLFTIVIALLLVGCFAESFCHYKTYTCRFLLSGDLHRDKPVDGRIWSKYYCPEYQCLGLDELEPGIYLPGQWSGRDAGLERHIYPVGPESHRSERDLEW